MSPASATLVSDYLGTAGNFAVLSSGSATIGNAAVVNGDVGVKTTSSYTVVSGATINGTQHHDATANQAITDLAAGITAFNSLMPVVGGCLAAFPTALTPGSYCIPAATLLADTTLTLSNPANDPNPIYSIRVLANGSGSFGLNPGVMLTIMADSELDKFILQSGSMSIGQSLVGNPAGIFLGGDALVDNFIFDTGSVTFGLGSTSYGVFVASLSISQLPPDTKLCGRALSGGSSTIQGIVNAPPAENGLCSFNEESGEGGEGQVPEPWTLSLFWGSLLGLAAIKRQRRPRLLTA